MEIDGPEGPTEDGPPVGPPGGPTGGPSSHARKSRSEGKSAAFFLAKSDECLSSLPPNVPLAIKFLEKGVGLFPENVELLQRLAGEYAEEGRVEEAKQLLQKAIQLEPAAGPVKFFQLAQLEEGLSCLSLNGRGISLLESALSSLNKKSSSKQQADRRMQRELEGQLVAGYCAVAELFLTDLCGEEDAERRAEEAVEKALTLQPENPQAILCLAQLRKVKDDAEGAVEAARRLYSAIKTYNEKLAADSVLLTGAAADAAEEEGECEVSIETRVNACRLFVDVGLAEEATHVLRACLEEDDEDDFEVALECLDELRERLKRCSIPSDHPMAHHERQLRDYIQQQQQQQQQQRRDEADKSASDSASSSDDEGDEEVTSE